MKEHEEEQRSEERKGKVKTQMSLMVAVHSSPNRASSSHVASVPRVAVATAIGPHPQTTEQGHSQTYVSLFALDLCYSGSGLWICVV